jgi:SprT protein
MQTPFKYLVKEIAKKEKQLKKIVEAEFGKGKAPKIEVEFELNSSNSLGTCSNFKNVNDAYKIKLNAAVLNELKQSYIDDVFVHEYAHACVSELVGHYNKFNHKKIMPHGREFKSFCAMFGISGRATTSVAHGSKALKKSGRKIKRVAYECDCQTHEITVNQHNKIQSGAAKYTCRACKSYLVKKVAVAA